MRLKAFYFFLIVAVLVACEKPQAPEFKYLENIVVELESLSTANLHADAILYNPNKNNVTIKGAVINIMVGDKTIAMLDKEYDIKVEGNKEFTVPLDVKIRLKDLNLNAIGAAFGLDGGDGQMIHYVGKIKLKAYGMPFSVKVDYKDKINIKI